MPRLAAAAVAILIGGTFGGTVGARAGAPVGLSATMPPVGGRPVKVAADGLREQRLALRRPALNNPLLALRRAPVDVSATAASRRVNLAAAQWPLGPSRLTSTRPGRNELLVLPELSGLPSGLSPDRIARFAEPRGGPFESALVAQARAAAGDPAVRHSPVVPAPGTWINQQQLIAGQRNDLYLPLVLDPQNRCFQVWKRAGHGVVPCR